MKFLVALSSLKDGINKVMPAIPPKSTLPVLEHINLQLENNELRMISTDQDITILHNLEVTGLQNGRILVPARKLNEITKALGNSGEIEFEIDEVNFDIKLKTSTGKYHMKGLNPDEYLDLPELFESNKPDFDGENITGDLVGKAAFFTKFEISRLCTKTSFAVSNDEFRPAMTGVLFQFRSDYINAVSTDSYRLVRATSHPENPQLPEEVDVIIPSKTIDLLKNVDDDVLLSFIENSSSNITHIRFDVGSSVFVTRIIDEKFPPYESVIPNNNELIARVDKAELLKSIKLVSIFSSNISKQIRVQLKENELVIKGQDEDSGSDAVETIQCQYSGTEIEIGFNYKFLEDAVSNIDTGDEGEVLLTLSEPTRPALILPNEEAKELLMLIMPVRIS